MPPESPSSSHGREPMGRVTTERLWIEPMRPAHAAALHAALDHPEIAEALGEPDVTTVEALVARIGAVTTGPADRPGERWWNFAVGLREQPETVVGRLEATTLGDWGEVAYVFDPRRWGRGYATEGVTWLVDHLEAEGIGELWACVSPVNDRSSRLAERCGFSRVDTWTRPLPSYDDGDVVLVRRPTADRRPRVGGST